MKSPEQKAKEQRKMRERLLGKETEPIILEDAKTKTGFEVEQHYSIKQLSELIGWSTTTIRDQFRGEMGVLRFAGPGELTRKRGYTTVAIPESAVKRVLQRLKDAAKAF
jgi:AraC-like DNA-binding protein